jgi:hypothetical protein
VILAPAQETVSSAVPESKGIVRGPTQKAASAELRPCLIYWLDMGSLWKKMYYIEGSVPATLELKKEFSGRYVLDVMKKGGLYVGITVPRDSPMFLVDLEKARVTCKESQRSIR